MNHNEQNPHNRADNFQLDIQFDDLFEESAEESHPIPKGEVYFSNPPTIPPPPPPTKKKRTPLLRFGVFVGLLAVTIGTLSSLGISLMKDIFALGRAPREYSITIPPDQTTNQIVDLLAAHGLVQQKALCKTFLGAMKFLQTKNNVRIDETYLPDTYHVNATSGLEELLGSFKEPPRSSESVKLLFPEGYTVGQILEKISQYRVASFDQLQRGASSVPFDQYAFLKEIDPNGRYYRYEGYLFPDTYEFLVGESASSVLRRFFDNFQNKWTELYQKDAETLGLSLDQVLILASIIQKEAANASQMPDVSGVLHNRLNNASVYPMLECNSTGDYVLNHIAPQMEAGSAALYQEYFNTYRRAGLPAGPICNPGIKAIEAALRPSSHAYYYFQHDKNGKIYLSKTRSAHNQITTDLLLQGLAQ